MYKSLKTRIVGIAPLLMHNGQTADPLNKFAKAMREITLKRGKKTEADIIELSRIEFFAGLYMGTDGPIIPALMVEANLIDGARKSRMGKLAQAGVIVERHARLDYDGPRTADELFEDERFKYKVSVVVDRKKIMRIRPIFREWSAEVEISYLDDVLNERDLLTALRNAGSLAGIGDWRPRYGRYALEADIKSMALAAD